MEPLLIKYLFDGLASDPSMRIVLIGVGAMLGLALFQELRGGILNWYIWKVRIELQLRLQSLLVERLNTLLLSYHQEAGVGRIMTRLDRG